MSGIGNVHFLMGEHGGFCLHQTAPDIYELHIAIKPEGRGKWGFDAQREVINFAAQNGVGTLLALIDPNHKPLAVYARRGGMRPTEHSVEALGTTYQIYSLEVPSCRQQ